MYLIIAKIANHAKCWLDKTDIFFSCKILDELLVIAGYPQSSRKPKNKGSLPIYGLQPSYCDFNSLSTFPYHKSCLTISFLLQSASLSILMDTSYQEYWADAHLQSFLVYFLRVLPIHEKFF